MKQSGVGSLFDSEISDEVFVMYETEMKNMVENANTEELRLN